MSKPHFRTLICALGMAALACAHARPPGAQPATDAKAAIIATSRAFSAAYVGNDMNALGQLYTEDAVLLPHGREVRGRVEIQRFFTRKPPYRQVAHSMESANLDLRGDTAIDTGTWHSTVQRGDEPPNAASGAYLVVWVRDDAGAWRIKYDMWHPPAKPATP